VKFHWPLLPLRICIRALLNVGLFLCRIISWSTFVLTMPHTFIFLVKGMVDLCFGDYLGDIDFLCPTVNCLDGDVLADEGDVTCTCCTWNGC
jgi:hypothetical protein